MIYRLYFHIHPDKVAIYLVRIGIPGLKHEIRLLSIPMPGEIFSEVNGCILFSA